MSLVRSSLRALAISRSTCLPIVVVALPASADAWATAPATESSAAGACRELQPPASGSAATARTMEAMRRLFMAWIPFRCREGLAGARPASHRSVVVAPAAQADGAEDHRHARHRTDPQLRRRQHGVGGAHRGQRVERVVATEVL